MPVSSDKSPAIRDPFESRLVSLMVRFSRTNLDLTTPIGQLTMSITTADRGSAMAVKRLMDDWQTRYRAPAADPTPFYSTIGHDDRSIS